MEYWDDDVLSLCAPEDDSDREDPLEDYTEEVVVEEEYEEYIVVDEVHEDDEDVPEANFSGLGALGPMPVAKECPVCGLRTRGKLRRHVLRAHLPWFWAGTTACWECEVQETQASTLTVRHTEQHQMGDIFNERNLHLWCQLIIGSLHLLKSWFECTDLDGLLQYVVSRRLHSGNKSSFSEQERQLLMFFSENYSPRMVYADHFKLNPPNHVVCITNWEIMAALLRRLGPRYQEMFLQHRECLTYEGHAVDAPITQPENPFLFVDSHFHLDLILQRTRLRTFNHLQSVVLPDASPDDPGFYYGIANYVFPQHWNRWAEQVGSATRLYVSFGIHPHVAAEGVTTSTWGDLRLLSTNYRCVALGETGLDFTTRCSCRRCRTPEVCRQRMQANQEEVLRMTLELARVRGLPVILHCRDSGDGSAAARTLAIIREGNFTRLRFHRHCFLGSVQELVEWQTLPDIVFGVTGAFFRSHQNNRALIPRIPSHQLVVESDAPYLSPLSCCPINSPWNLWDIIQEISRLRNVPLSVLLWVVNNNALQLYRIPKSGVRQHMDMGP